MTLNEWDKFVNQKLPKAKAFEYDYSELLSKLLADWKASNECIRKSMQRTIEKCQACKEKGYQGAWNDGQANLAKDVQRSIK